MKEFQKLLVWTGTAWVANEFIYEQFIAGSRFVPLGSPMEPLARAATIAVAMWGSQQLFRARR